MENRQTKKSKEIEKSKGWRVRDSRKQGAQIGTNRKKTGKSEQIGINRGDPLLPTPNRGLRNTRDPLSLIQDHGKGGFEFKGGSLHDGFGGSGEHLTLLLLVLQNTAQ